MGRFASRSLDPKSTRSTGARRPTRWRRNVKRSKRSWSGSQERPHAGKELVQIYQERMEEVEEEDERVRLYRRMANITFHELNRPQEAQAFFEGILENHPEDAESLDALEKIFSVTNDWENLLKIYRKRVDLEDDPQIKVEILFKAGVIEEEKLENMDGAAEVYAAIVEIEPTDMRALRASERIQEVREDWPALIDVLEKQRQVTAEDGDRVDLLYPASGSSSKRSCQR